MTDKEIKRLAATVDQKNVAQAMKLDEKVGQLEAENRELRSMMPLLDKAGQGDRDQQAIAWSMVHRTLVDAGLESFMDGLGDNGATRAVKFIRHLATQAKLVARPDAE